MALTREETLVAARAALAWPVGTDGSDWEWKDADGYWHP